ncbi:hypothetical protein ACWDUN_23680 [Mycobacterium sp. NPDC003323]
MTGPVVLVTGPALAGVSTLTAALRTYLPDHTITEDTAGQAPDAVIFALSALNPPAASDLALLDGAARRTDLVIGALTKIDVRPDWSTVLNAAAAACAQHAPRYRMMRWAGAAAAPRDGAPLLAELVALLTGGLADTALPARNSLRARETRLGELIASMTGPDTAAVDLHRRRAGELQTIRRQRSAQAVLLRMSLQRARVDLGQLARNRCSVLRSALVADAAEWRRHDDFGAHAHGQVITVLTALDEAIGVRTREVAAELALPPPAPLPTTPPEVDRPVLPSRRLERQLMTVLGAGFGLGVALAAGRLLTGLAPGEAAVAAGAGAALGLALMLWVVGARGLLHDRAQLDRWAAGLADTVRGHAEALVATRMLAAEAHFAAESVVRAERAAAQTARRVAAIDDRLRARAMAAAATATTRDRRLSALRAALREVRQQLNRVTAE